MASITSIEDHIDQDTAYYIGTRIAPWMSSATVIAMIPWTVFGAIPPLIFGVVTGGMVFFPFVIYGFVRCTLRMIRLYRS